MRVKSPTEPTGGTLNRGSAVVGGTDIFRCGETGGNQGGGLVGLSDKRITAWSGG